MYLLCECFHVSATSLHYHRHNVVIKGQHRQVGQQASLHNVAHYLLLIIRAFVRRCSLPFVQISGTMTLSPPESVQHGYELATEVKD